MGIKPTIASIPNENKVQKASKIQMVALLCIFINFLRGYNRNALL